jgi:hypothetical protein
MKKDLLILLMICVVVIFIITGTKIQSVDDYYLTHIDTITEDSETVFLSVNCSTILNNMDKLEAGYEKYIPEDGYILAENEYVLRKDDTVFSILDRALKYNKIPLVRQKTFIDGYSSVYIQGINNIFEFSCGEQSGWHYRVNGIFPSYASSLYKLADGDIIEILYTCDLGHDIGRINYIIII